MADPVVPSPENMCHRWAPIRSRQASPAAVKWRCTCGKTTITFAMPPHDHTKQEPGESLMGRDIYHVD